MATLATLTRRALERLLRLGDERRVDADRGDGRDRRVAGLRVDRLRAQRPDLARRVAALEGREIHHPDREVEGPQLRGLLDRAALEALDAQLDADLVDRGLAPEHAPERPRAPAGPRADELAGALAGDRVGLPDGHGTVRIHRAPTPSGRTIGPMTDQLTMRLEPPLPKLPAGLRPMLARPLPEPFDSDGAPVRADLGRGAGAGADRAGRGRRARATSCSSPRTGPPGRRRSSSPGSAARVQARSAVLDGEIVVVDEAGRLDARGARRGGFAGEPGRPLSYLAFDLLAPRRPVPPEPRPGPAPRAAAPGAPARATRSSPCRRSRPRAGRCSRRSRRRASSGSARGSGAARTCPGVRSRLWRSVAVGGCGGRGAGAGRRRGPRDGRRASIAGRAGRGGAGAGADPPPAPRVRGRRAGRRLARQAGGRTIAPTIWRAPGRWP